MDHKFAMLLLACTGYITIEFGHTGGWCRTSCQPKQRPQASASCLPHRSRQRFNEDPTKAQSYTTVLIFLERAKRRRTAARLRKVARFKFCALNNDKAQTMSLSPSAPYPPVTTETALSRSLHGMTVALATSSHFVSYSDAAALGRNLLLITGSGHVK